MASRLLLFCFALCGAVTAAAQPAGAGDGAGPVATPMAIEIEVVELVAEPEGAWPLLLLRLRNGTEGVVAGWAFELEAAGRIVDGYHDLLVLQAAAPGEAATLELFRLEQPPRPFRLRLSVVEAWAAEKVTAPPPEGGDSWRLLAPLEGGPVSMEIVVE